jgi:hypothetical protein
MIKNDDLYVDSLGFYGVSGFVSFFGLSSETMIFLRGVVLDVQSFVMDILSSSVSI